MSSPIKNRIGTIFIPVKDLQKSAEWYSRILGLPLNKVSPPAYNLEIEGSTGLTLDCDNFDSPIRKGEVQPSPNGLFYFYTEDIEESYHFLQENDVEIAGELTRIYNVAFLHFRDPDGNIIMVYNGGM